MSLLQRLKTPFTEGAGEDTTQSRPRARLVGQLLRERREELGLDLGEVGAALCIKPVFLAAIEEGRAQDLPGPTYAIGFLRAYAQHLGVDAEKALDRFKAESSDLQARPDLSLPVPLGERSMPGVAMLIVALILALCGYGTWYYLSTGERTRPEKVAAVPEALRTPPAAAVPPSADPVPGAVPGEAAGAPPPVPAAGVAAAAPSPVAGSAAPALEADAGKASAPAVAAAPATPPATSLAGPPGAAAPGGAGAPAAAGRVAIQALADCWIQVRDADQSIVFSRVLKAHEVYRVPARSGLSLRTGNAGALAITVDGKPAPSIGSVGMLRRDVALEPEALIGGTAVRG